MSKKDAISKNLREVSKNSKQRCANCMWYIPLGESGEGQCNKHQFNVSETQLCDQWAKGYEGKHNTNLIREYNQNTFERPFTEHPTAKRPSPTREDYDAHYVIRYFIKYASKDYNPIIEVDDKTYQKAPATYYKKMSLKWKINGPKDTIIENGAVIDKGIAEANRDTVKLKERIFLGIKDYLIDYTELAYTKVKSTNVDFKSKRKPTRKSVYGSGTRRPSTQPPDGGSENE
jgi:hypothetical protein